MKRSIRPANIAARTLAGIAGGWLFVYGGSALCIVALLAFGMRYDDARLLVYLLAFLVYVSALCWAFSARSAARAVATLFGGGAALCAAAWWLARS